MTGEFEQEVHAAFQIFIAAVTRAAERTAVETIRSACARASLRAVRVVGASDRGPPPGKSMARRAMDDAAVRMTVVAYLREHSGTSPTRLGLTLGINHGPLRRYLRELVDDGTIRIEERFVGFGRQRHRACFLVEHVNPSAAESPAAPAEAMA